VPRFVPDVRKSITLKRQTTQKDLHAISRTCLTLRHLEFIGSLALLRFVSAIHQFAFPSRSFFYQQEFVLIVRCYL
jgi:hypothetical protein